MHDSCYIRSLEIKTPRWLLVALVGAARHNGKCNTQHQSRPKVPRETNMSRRCARSSSVPATCLPLSGYLKTQDVPVPVCLYTIAVPNNQTFSLPPFQNSSKPKALPITARSTLSWTSISDGRD